ncbi:MAG: thioredoxin, partial [Myxococcales bacterium]|nr:thioredoxin [Myxococcales bacterium]
MAGQNVHEFDESNWETEVVGHTTGPVLVDFHASWCGPCKLLTPIVEKLAVEYEGKLKVGKVDIDAAPRLAQKYGITSVPTVMVFEGGQKKASHVGVAKREKLL